MGSVVRSCTEDGDQEVYVIVYIVTSGWPHDCGQTLGVYSDVALAIAYCENECLGAYLDWTRSHKEPGHRYSFRGRTTWRWFKRQSWQHCLASAQMRGVGRDGDRYWWCVEAFDLRGYRVYDL